MMLLPCFRASFARHLEGHLLTRLRQLHAPGDLVISRSHVLRNCRSSGNAWNSAAEGVAESAAAESTCQKKRHCTHGPLILLSLEVAMLCLQKHQSLPWLHLVAFYPPGTHKRAGPSSL